MDQHELKNALQAAIEAVVGKMNSQGDAYREFNADLEAAVSRLATLLDNRK